MRIGFVLTRFPKLSETFVLDQIVGLIERGHDVRIFARAPSGERARHDELERYHLLDRTTYFGPSGRLLPRLLGVPGILAAELPANARPVVRALNPLRGRRALSLKNLYLAHGAKQALDCDILHAHFGPNGVAAVTLSEVWRRPAKVVTTFHGYDVAKRAWSRPNGPYRELFAKGDLFLAHSDDMAARLVRLGCPAARIEKLPLGLNLKDFEFATRRRPESGPPVLLSVARLVEKKGLEYAIRAVARLREEGRPLSYVIAGDGPLRGQLERLIARLGLSDTVQILGFKNRSEVRQLYRTAHIFLLPSVTARDGDREGSPVVLLEAQATGLPVVATRHSAIPEIVADGQSGYLVPERDADALAARLRDLLANPERWAEFGRAGRAIIVENHDQRRHCDRLEQLCLRVLHHPAGAGERR